MESNDCENRSEIGSGITDEVTLGELEQAQQLSQEILIRNEINANAMIGEIKSPSALASMFENAHLLGFSAGVEYLSSRYDMRQVRGDGNCFYRSLLYSYLEQLLCSIIEANENCTLAVKELARFKTFIERSKADLVEIGYEEFAIESFHDMFMELLDGLPSMSRDSLLALFQEDGSGDYYTWYMRVLCACYMRRNDERFFPFVDDGLCIDMKSYCEREVEPMGKECEQLQIIALTEYMGLSVDIHYLDGREFDPVSGPPIITLPETESSHVRIHLLYRPGHYDILYPKK
jgi:ubiquitin thioesterase protein OTUB1